MRARKKTGQAQNTLSLTLDKAATGNRFIQGLSGKQQRVLPIVLSGFSNGGILSQNPFKCIVEIAEDANSLFTEVLTKRLKHAGQSKYQVSIH